MSALSAPGQLSPELERPLIAVETCLTELGEALARRDSTAVEQHAAHLHGLLAQAVQSFAEAARSGSLPASLRHRLVAAGGKMAAQRESLARGNASLDRALEVLIPTEPTGLYGASGKAERKSLGGSGYQA